MDEAQALYRCPTDAGPRDSAIIGCGGQFEAEPDEEGWVDCPHCGIAFEASQGLPA